MFVLYIYWNGYFIFKFKDFDEIGNQILAVRKALNDVKKFRGIVKIKDEYSFSNTKEASESLEMIKNGKVPVNLANFLLSQKTKTIKSFGCENMQLKNVLKDNYGIKINNSDIIIELIRSIKIHILSFIKKSGDQKSLLKSLCNHQLNERVSAMGYVIPAGFNFLKSIEKSISKKTEKVRKLIKTIFPELMKEDLFKNDDLLIDFLDKHFENENNIGKEYQHIVEIIKNSQGIGFSETNIEFLRILINTIKELKMQLKLITEQTYKITQNVAPNLTALLENTNAVKTENDLSASELITTAGSMKQLSTLTSTQIHSITIENNLFKRKVTDDSLAQLELNKFKSHKAKLLSEKSALAVKVDFFSKSKNNDYGNELSKNVNLKLNEWSNKNLARIEDREERIQKHKLRRKIKRKKWLQRKKENQISEKIDI